MRHLLASVALIAATAILAGCSTIEQLASGPPAAPDCPPVALLADADKLTQFREGPGRDITDIEVEAEITAFQGSCQYVDDGNVAVLNLAVAIDARRGPADSDRRTDTAFFVAIPAFYPADSAKSVMPFTFIFPENTNRVRYVEENVELRIPMTKGDDLSAYQVVLGFQLTQEQLNYNRAQR